MYQQQLNLLKAQAAVWWESVECCSLRPGAARADFPVVADPSNISARTPRAPPPFFSVRFSLPARQEHVILLKPLESQMLGSQCWQLHLFGRREGSSLIAQQQSIGLKQW